VAGDLTRPDLDELDWTPERRAASLRTVYEEAESWYAEKRKGKRQWGRLLRVLALLLIAAAAVIPILAQTYEHDGKPWISPAWASILLVVAAALVGLDRYFGFSSAWMRFMEAELRVTRLRHTFEYDWETTRAGATGAVGGGVAALLPLAQTFVLGVDGVLADETAAWIAVFRSSLATAEQSLAKAQQ
jgi:SMODS and SLOG-associating 2TM effector domain 2